MTAPNVISLAEWRKRLRPEPPAVDPAFADAWESIFEAMELIEVFPLKRAQEARQLLLRGLHVMLARENRRLGRG